MELAIVTVQSRRLMARQPAPDEAERERLLLSLSQVGPNKTIGYLPLYTIRDFVQLSPETIAADAAARGLASEQFGPEKCCIKSGALYVYDREGLTQLLATYAGTLEADNLPLDPDRFVAHIAAVWFQPNHPAYAVIAAAFGEIA